MGRLKKLLNRSDAHEVGAPRAPRRVAIVRESDAVALAKECTLFYGDLGDGQATTYFAMPAVPTGWFLIRVPAKRPTDA